MGAKPPRDGRERRLPIEGVLEFLGGRLRVRVELEEECLVDRHAPRVRGAPDGSGRAGGQTLDDPAQHVRLGVELGQGGERPFGRFVGAAARLVLPDGEH